MSRAFRIRSADSRTETVHVEDGICTQLEILDVLPKEEMAELLARELAERGFERDGRIMRKVDGEVNIDVDLVEGTVSARIAVEKVVEAQGSEEGWSETPEGTDDLRRRMKGAVDRQIQRKFDSERGKLTDQAAATLEKSLRDVKDDLDRAASRATAEGLKVKASRLGDIEEVTEDPETGSITIRVRV